MKRKLIVILLVITLMLSVSVSTVLANPGRPPVVQSTFIEIENDGSQELIIEEEANQSAGSTEKFWIVQMIKKVLYKLHS